MRVSARTRDMAKDKRAEIVHWIQSVEQAHTLGPPEELSDWGLTSNPDVQRPHGSLSPVHSPTLEVAVSHTSLPRSPFIGRKSVSSLTHALKKTHSIPTTERPGLQRVEEESKKMARETHKVIRYSRQTSLSPIPDPPPSLELPTFDPERETSSPEGRPKPLRRHTTLAGSPQPKSKLILSKSSPSLEAKSVSVSPNLSANRKAPLERARAIERQGSFSEDEISSLSSDRVESLEGDSLKGSSDYNISPVYSSSVFQCEDEGSPPLSPPQTGIATSTAEPTSEMRHFALDNTEKQADLEERALPALKQQELAMLSGSIGSKLPQLTLLLGMKYSDYEKVRATERSSEGQALGILTQWYQSGRGERQELVDALNMAGHGWIAKLLLHGELENLYEEEKETSGRGTPSSLSSQSPPKPRTGLPSPPKPLECAIRLHSPLETCEVSPPSVHRLSGARSFTFDTSQGPSPTATKHPPRHIKFLSKQSRFQSAASTDQSAQPRMHPPLSSLNRRFAGFSSIRASVSNKTYDTKNPEQDICKSSMQTEEWIRKGTLDEPGSRNQRGSCYNPVPAEKPPTSFPQRTHSLFESHRSHQFHSLLQQQSQERIHTYRPFTHSHQFAWSSSHTSKEPDCELKKDLVNRQDSGLGASTASTKFNF